MTDTMNPPIDAVDPWAALGVSTKEIDSRTADIPGDVIDALDYAVRYFTTVDSKKLRYVQCANELEAELLIDQIHRFSLARGVSTSTLERRDTVVVFRFSKPRANGDPGTDEVPEDDTV